MLGVLRRCAWRTGETVLGVAGLRVCQRADAARPQDWCDRLAGLSSWRVGRALTGGCRSQLLPTACALCPSLRTLFDARERIVVVGDRGIRLASGEGSQSRRALPRATVIRGPSCEWRDAPGDGDARGVRTGKSITVVLLTLRVRPSRRHNLTRSVRSTFQKATLIDSPILSRVHLAQGQVRGRNRERRGLGSLFSLGPYHSLPAPAGKHLGLCIP